VSVGPVAPTHRMFAAGSVHGEIAVLLMFRFELPAETTKSVFGAPLIAASSAGDVYAPPRLAFTTRAPMLPA